MITILTPTFNRAYTLERLFNSLEQQSSNDFEWVVVDDGSTDNTRKLIDKFLEKSKFSINYIYQENRGKPSAINNGVMKSKGDYIFIVDSDDMLTRNCIKKLSNDILNLNDNYIKFSGLCYRKGNFDGTMLGPTFDKSESEFSLLTATELKNELNVDLAYCFKKERLLNCKFPVFKNEKFIPELYIWNKITDFEKVAVYKNEILYLCEYLPDGLTANFNTQLKKNPNGFLIYYKNQFFREKTLKNRVKMLLRSVQCIIYSLVKV